MNKLLVFNKKKFFLAYGMLIFAPLNAFAQNVTSEASPLKPLYECAKITDNNTRLECYDKNVKQISQSEEKKEIIALDAPKMKALKKDAFGFSIPSLPKLFSIKNELDNKIENQNLIVSSIGIHQGKTAIFTDNNQIWLVIDKDEILPPGNAPWEVNIESASLGSYLMNFKGLKKGYRVKRVE